MCLRCPIIKTFPSTPCFMFFSFALELFFLDGFSFAQAGEEPCPLDPWIVAPDKSKYVDLQTLKLQENPEVRNSLPVASSCSTDHHVGSLRIGNFRFCLRVCFICNVFIVFKDVPTGELPRNTLVSIDRHLVQTIVPGTRLTVMGIYSIYQASAA